MAEANSKRRWTRLKGTLRNCPECGEQFEPKANKQKTCGAECGNRAGHRKLMKRKPCACAVCGKEFLPKKGDRTTCCSRECGFEYQRRKRRAPFCVAIAVNCCMCGEAFIARRHGRKRCPACARKSTSIAREVYTCGYCGVRFPYRATGGRPRGYCSSRCKRAAVRLAKPGKPRERARKFGVAYEYVNPRRVFDRDGWRCQICGKRTPKARRGTTHQNAPELDHRIPISLGGGHTYDNVQCVCRACNIAKSNRSEVGQLPLFAA